VWAVRNNPNRAHNYLQDFWKRFTIFNKAQYLQKNRKQEITQSNLTWTYLEAHQGYQPTCAAHYCLAQLPGIFLPLAPKQLRGMHAMLAVEQLLACLAKPSSSLERWLGWAGRWAYWVGAR